ncbi:hypothetical protein SB822_02595 [Paraburkholderia sp. SIMBA_054]
MNILRDGTLDGVRLAKRCFASLILITLTGLAYADTAPAPGSCPSIAAVNASAETLRSVVNFLLTPFVDADATISSFANATASSLMTGAYVVGGILASAFLLWSTLKYIADGSSNYVSLLMETAAPAALCAGVLNQYSSVLSGVQGIFDSMGVSATGGLTTAIAKFGISLFNGLVTAMEAIFVATVCMPMQTSGLGTVLYALMMLTVIIAAIAFAAVALAELIGVMLFGSVLMGVGIVVGPYFVAAAATPWSRPLMMEWLGFTMAAFFYKSLISIVLSLIQPLIVSFSTQTAAAATSTTGIQFGSAVALLGLVWVMRNVFLKIPHMAAELLGNGHAQEVSIVNDGMKLARMIAGMSK